MAEGTFCQEPAGRSCVRSIDGDHASRSCSRSTKRDWMPDANRFARNDHRLLRRSQFSGCPHCAVLRTTHGEGLRWGCRACSVLLADAGHNLSARTVTDYRVRAYFLPIFGGKSQRSFPSSDSGSTSTSATPALESLSDAPVNPEITLVKSGSWPTSIRTFARCRFTTVRNLLLPNPGASDSSLRTFALRWSAAISPVCAAWGNRLVTIKSRRTSRRSRNFATSRISLFPRLVNGRSSSGFFQFGQSASPCLRK